MFELSSLPLLVKGRSRSINQENYTGEKGKGGMASSDLGPGRKGSPCIRKVEPGSTITLGEIQGTGVIQSESFSGISGAGSWVTGGT